VRNFLCIILFLSISVITCSCSTASSLQSSLTSSVSASDVTSATVLLTSSESSTPVDQTISQSQEESTQTSKIDPVELLAAMTLENFPRIDGSTATIPLAIGLMTEITGCSESDVEERTVFSMTDPSYHQLAQGNADLLLVYAPAQITRNELDIDNKMEMFEIGLDALVFFVNADNPVDSLTSDQIRGIYSGEITNWNEVGGNDVEIVPFQRPELSGSQTLMNELMMKDTIKIPPTQENISESMADSIRDVAAFDAQASAIGYSVYYYAKNMYANPDLKFIAVDGVLPSNESINSGDYGYTNPFYCVLPLDPTAEAKVIFEYLLSEDGQRLLESCGYVPIMKID